MLSMHLRHSQLVVGWKSLVNLSSFYGRIGTERYFNMQKFTLFSILNGIEWALILFTLEK